MRSEEKQRTFLPDTGGQPKNYTIEDHHYLAEGSHIRHLFEEFRREVLVHRPMRCRGVPQTLHRLQGRDQFRRRGPPDDPVETEPEHEIPRTP